METTAVLIPSKGSQVLDTSETGYFTPLRKGLDARGISTVPVTIDWDGKEIDGWVDEAEEQVQDVDPRNTMVIGFSLGALIAVHLSTRVPFTQAVLCSMSPYFAEDMPEWDPKWVEINGEARMAALGSYALESLLASRKVHRMSFMYSLLEWPQVGVTAERAFEQIGSGASTTKLHAAGHDIRHPSYLGGIWRTALGEHETLARKDEV